MKGNGRWQEAKIGIVLAGIMFAFVLAAMVPMVSTESRGDNFNHIVVQPATQKVLIGQNLEFEGFDGTVTISRLVSGDIENIYHADDDGRIYNVNWPTTGAYYVNYRSATDYDVQLSVEYPNMPLGLKVGTRKVSSIDVGTELTIDTSGMNLFSEDQVDLVVIGPDGQIKLDEVNNQKFTDITVAELVSNFGGSPNSLETSRWAIGDYTFRVKTDEENACGLEAASSVKPLKIIRGTITIDTETTSTVERDTLKLTVTGVADDGIRVESLPLSKNVLFKEGIDDTPIGANYHTNWFTDTIDADGIRRYAVEFNHTGTYTIKVTVTSGDPARVNDDDTVDITVLEKEVVFDLPSTVVIGDKVTIKGTATSGTYVSVYVDDELYKKLENIVLVNGEFSQEVKTTDVGMNVPGSVRLKAWIDCLTKAGEERPIRSPDGEDAVLLTTPSLTAELSADAVALKDDFTVFGTAQGATEVTILSVPPKGGGGKSLLDKGDTGLSLRKASVSTTDYTYSKKLTVQEDATTGYYNEYVLSIGMDGFWGMTGEADLDAAFEKKYGIADLSGASIATKTQTEIQDILVDMVYAPGSDDLMVKLRLKVETPYVLLHPVPDVKAPAPLVVRGTSNRQEGYTIVVTCISATTELQPQTVQVENGTFRATFDTTDAVTGTYTVKADDGDGHTAEETVEITSTSTPTVGVEELWTILDEKVLPEYPTLLAGVNVAYLKQVSADSLNDDVKVVVDNMKFPSSAEVYSYDYILTIPSATNATVKKFKASAEEYVTEFLTAGDTLYSVTWILINGETVKTVAVGKLKNTTFTAKYESFADAIVEVITSNETEVEVLTTSSTGSNRAKWKNGLGIPKALADIEISGTSPDGCVIQGISASFVGTASFPYVIEPSSATPPHTIWCFPKKGCKCKTYVDKMECATTTQSYSVKLRIGIGPVSMDVMTYGGDLSAWICADGDSGAGRGY